MTEITIKGKGLIKKIEKDTTPGSEYLTYTPDNGELVCITDGTSAYLVVGTLVEGQKQHLDNCPKVGGSSYEETDLVWEDVTTAFPSSGIMPTLDFSKLASIKGDIV